MVTEWKVFVKVLTKRDGPQITQTEICVICGVNEGYGTIMMVPTAGPTGIAPTALSIVITRPKSASATSDLISASLRSFVFTIWPSLVNVLSGPTAQTRKL